MWRQNTVFATATPSSSQSDCLILPSHTRNWELSNEYHFTLLWEHFWHFPHYTVSALIRPRGCLKTFMSQVWGSFTKWGYTGLPPPSVKMSWPISAHKTRLVLVLKTSLLSYKYMRVLLQFKHPLGVRILLLQWNCIGSINNSQIVVHITNKNFHWFLIGHNTNPKDGIS